MPLRTSHAQGAPLTAAQWEALGKTALDAKDYPTAIRDFQNAGQADLKNPDYAIDLAQAYVAAKQYAAGEKLLSLALPIFPDINERRRLLLAMGELQSAWGRDLSTQEKYLESASHFQYAADIEEPLNPILAIDDLICVADTFNVLSQYDRAIPVSLHALGLAQTIKDQKREAAVLRQLTDYSSLSFRFNDALKYGSQGLAAARAAKSQYFEADLFKSLGDVYWHGLKQSAPALQNYTEALRIWRELGDHANEIRTLILLASCYEGSDHYDEAITMAQAAQELATRNSDTSLTAQALTHLGDIYRDLYRYDVAIHYYNEALPIVRTTGIRGNEVPILMSLGGAYVELKAYQDAEKNYQAALSITKELRLARMESLALISLGYSLDNSGQFLKAIQAFKTALTFSQLQNDILGQIHSITQIGRMYTKLHQYKESIQYLERAAVMAHQFGDFDNEAFIYYNSSESFLRLKRFDECLSHLHLALALERQSQSVHSQFWTLSELMRVNAIFGKTQEAIFYGKAAINSLIELKGRLGSFDPATQNTFNYNNANITAYRTLIELLVRQGRLTEAQQVMDLMKGKEYFDFVRRDASENLGAVTLTTQEKTWQARYTQIADRVTAIGQKRQALLAKLELSKRSKTTLFTAADRKALKLAESDLKVASLAFQSVLIKLSVEFSKAPPKRLADVQAPSELSTTVKNLGPGTVALYTIVEPDKYRVIVITSQTQKAEEYAIDAHVLNKKVLALREALQDPNVDPRPLAHELYQILIGPIERDLQGANAKTLMWSLDGVLRYLPMAVLYDGQHYLVERYRSEVFTLASRSQFENTAPTTWSALGFGVSQAHPGFDALPAVPFELHGIIQDAADPTVGVLPGSVLLDSQFTRDALVTNLGLRKYPVVHIASHFVFHPGDDTDSFLLLGDGAHLTLADIKAMPQVFGGVDLLTLSACDTAMEGEGADGREIEGCAVLAQRQGAHAVMASLWPVADASTQQLMRAFYGWRSAHPGATKGDALQQAQLALFHGDNLAIQTQPIAHRGVLSSSAPPPDFEADPKVPFAHPYYWAPFILLGNWK